MNNYQTRDIRNYQEKVKVFAGQNNEFIEVCKKVLLLLFKEYAGTVSIKLWNEEIVIGQEDTDYSLIIRSPYVLQHIVSSGSLNQLAEAHLRGELSVEGELEGVFDLLEFLQDRSFSFKEKVQLYLLVMKLKRSVSEEDKYLKGKRRRTMNSKGSIAHHYDVHNDFYRLFLDPEMVYSCAYFSDKEQNLHTAQQAKLDYLCKKLRLKSGEQLLDIGCGWGGLALWSAKHYGVQVHGITLSQEQYDYAVDRARQLELDQQVSFELRDYRDLKKGDYDKIVSVGMFEHIGTDNFPRYFSTVSRLLKPNGLFLNHGITNDTGWRDTPSTRFINSYIFPDGELARISDVTSAMETQSLEILDVEALRPHYVLTLRHWIKKLEENKAEAVAIAGERIFSLWQLYMAGSSHYFNKGSAGLYQILACKSRQPWHLPLRREELYQ